MTLAIAAANDRLSRLAFAAIKARGATPVALARSPGKAADLGIEVRAFDYASLPEDHYGRMLASFGLSED